MATGLTNLQAVDSALAAAIADNTTATQAVVADIATLTQELANVPAGDPDGQVATIAADLTSKVTALQQNTAALQAAVAPPATAPANSAPATESAPPTTAAPATTEPAA